MHKQRNKSYIFSLVFVINLNWKQVLFFIFKKRGNIHPRLVFVWRKSRVSYSGLAKFQKFGLFQSGLAWKNGVWHVRHSLAFFWPFLMVLAWKTLFGLILKPLAQLLLSAGIKNVSRDKRPLFSTTVTGQETTRFWERLRKLRHMPGLPDWPFHGQFRNIWPFFNCAGHEKTPLPIL